MDAAMQALRAMTAELRGSAERTAERLRQAAHDRGFWITADDRIGEGDLAKLLGFAVGTLKNRRREGRMPAAYRMGGNGHRVTYRMDDVARWIESTRDL